MLRGIRQRLWLPLSGITVLSLLGPVAHAADPVWYGWPAGQAAAPAPMPYYRAAPAPYSPQQPGYPMPYQQVGYQSVPCYTQPCAPVPCYTQPWAPAPSYQPACPQGLPVQPVTPAEPPKVTKEPKEAVPPEKKDTTPPPAAQQPTTPSTDQLAQAPETGPELGGGGAELASSNVGYIDSAIPRTQVRFRADAAFGDNRPDRAEFFYPKCGCFANPAAGVLFDPKASGPPLPEKKIDYQDYRTYIEFAPTNRFSGFVEIPIRHLDPQTNLNAGGLGDIEAGFKAALIADCDRYVTFQTKVYTASGDGSKGLGTNHVSVEPGMLLYQGIGDRARVEGEVRYWIPIGGSDFEGQVVRYGIGTSYDVVKTCKWSLAPVLEVVGWTVLNGKESDATTGGVYEAGGDTIVNAKAGLRWSTKHFSLYGGYGRALTGEVWYKEIYRLEAKWMY